MAPDTNSALDRLIEQLQKEKPALFDSIFIPKTRNPYQDHVNYDHFDFDQQPTFRELTF